MNYLLIYTLIFSSNSSRDIILIKKDLLLIDFIRPFRSLNIVKILTGAKLLNERFSPKNG